MSKIILIAHDIRSAQNIGSILRTADGLGLEQVYITGYSPYPLQTNDTRLPHESKAISNKISKTALGAEKDYGVYRDDLNLLIEELRSRSYVIAALEQSNQSITLNDLAGISKIALILGREVEGVDQRILSRVDQIVEIPMTGNKESFNVSVAAAIAAYHLTYMN